jgi:alkanesulfonate monooxygenase SsuD/methylene tetrahydromethanopterin reductase-like flavin-dependent oxidoreductase (luciferase family)
LPRPYQKGGPPLWVGGRSKAALRRTGFLADGWLVSSVSPREMGEGIETIRRHAREAGREIPEDHYGALIPYFFAGNAAEACARAGSAAQRRSDIPVEEYCAFGTPAAIRRKLQSYIDVGATKFVMRPCGPPELLAAQVELLAREVIPLIQTPFTPDERQARLGTALDG